MPSGKKLSPCLVTAWLLVCLLCTRTVAQQNLLYVHEDPDIGRTFGTVNLDTQQVTVIGESDQRLSDIAFDPNGILFGITGDTLYTVDPGSGLTTTVGRLETNEFMNALVFDVDGTLYGAARHSTTLFTIDPITGQSTAIGNIGVESAGDLAFGPDGLLYLSGVDDALWRIDLSTSADPIGTPVGTGLGFEDVFGLATAPDGRVFGYSNTGIFHVDLDAGVGTLFFDYGQNQTGLGKAGGGTFREEAINDAPVVIDAILDATVGEDVSHTFSGVDPDMRPASLKWSLDSFDGPNPQFMPTFDVATKEFRWDTSGSEVGDYFAKVSAFDGDLTGSGVLTIHLVPEPSTAVLCVLGLLFIAALKRVRGR